MTVSKSMNNGVIQCQQAPAHPAIAEASHGKEERPSPEQNALKLVVHTSEVQSSSKLIQKVISTEQ